VWQRLGEATHALQQAQDDGKKKDEDKHRHVIFIDKKTEAGQQQ